MHQGPDRLAGPLGQHARGQEAAHASLQGLIDADPDGITAGQARLALGRITMIMACQGGLVRDITVGDYLALLDAMHQTGSGGAGHP